MEAGNGIHAPESLTFDVVKATPQSLAASWGYIRMGLEAVRRNSPMATWVPEQVRQSIARDQGAELFFCVDEAKRLLGFYVMVPQLDPWLNCALTWVCWIVYSSDHGIIDRIEPIVMQQARERGFTDVRYVTAQPRIVKHMRDKGWVPVETICRKVVEY